MVQMENYSSILNASSYSWGPEKQKGKVIFPKPHSRYNQAANLPVPSTPSALCLTSWCYRLWCSLGTGRGEITWCLWARESLTPLSWWPTGQSGNSSANPRAQAGGTGNSCSAIASLDGRSLLCLQNRCWDRGIISYCNGSHFNVCLTHLSSIKVQQPSLFIWLEDTVIFTVRRIKHIEPLEWASLECTQSSCSAQSNSNIL